VTKAHLDDAVGKKLILYGQLYFRTLSTNGTPSTAPARSASGDSAESAGALNPLAGGFGGSIR
jgi:hypothetical protein